MNSIVLLRRYPVRWLTMVDGITLLLIGYYHIDVERMLPRPVWTGLYWLGGFGLILLAAFTSSTRRQIAVLAGLVAVPLVAEVTLLIAERFSDLSFQRLLGPIVFAVFGAHIVVRLAYWPLLVEVADRKLP